MKYPANLLAIFIKTFSYILGFFLEIDSNNN